MCPVKLRGRVAVVTGAGSGIGKVLATRLARDGASVVVADLKNYDVAAAEIAKSANARTLGLQVDVASEDDVARMAAETMKTFGRVDILVNNAAYFAPIELRPFERIDAAEWRKVMEVNTLGVFLCCRACVPHMRSGGYGRIINLASGAAIKGVPLFLHYVASKGAVIAMTRALAREVGKDGITANALAPGFTLSESMLKHAQQLKHGEGSKASRAIARDEHPEDLVGAVSFLASEDAAFITGQTLVVDGGSAMV
ncbi:MAG: dehydrogenase [Betaproteobacteria bacterium RIFCSPHIGHO2_12_FULL_69_13]|nr:MAG: dehydrogenase [Betaproteobacteria bacterium RIFCSPHIGHO2_12_FULL_69_13]OGA69485.1 MAG: dehydrogenase [Betaproteobacteria bacterium RIFCSPLOWO2_12_FULL_68_20]